HHRRLEHGSRSRRIRWHVRIRPAGGSALGARRVRGPRLRCVSDRVRRTEGNRVTEILERSYRVGPERRAAARRSRRGVAIVALVLLALSLLPWVVFTPQGVT